jgi:hypothetical protein
MTKLAIVVLLAISGIMNAQLNEKILFNTEYISIVETICEETPKPNPCAGQEVYLILTFNPKTVDITLKRVSSCGKEYIQSEFKYKWKLENNNEIKIFSNPNDIKYTCLENLKLIVEDKIIYGTKRSGKKWFEKYVFFNK